MNKKLFLTSKFINLLQPLDPNSNGEWGLMNVHQMVEHLIESFKVANGSIIVNEIITPLEKIEKMQSFIRSETPFKENTKNALMPDTPAPIINTDYSASLKNLQFEINEMYHFYDVNPNSTLRNPFFGDLDFSLNEALLFKHVVHHCKQFGITIIN